MIVNENQIQQFKKKISREKFISLDTETTGLNPFKHQLFSIIIATKTEEFYLNFNELTPGLPLQLLSRGIIKDLLDAFQGIIFLHNAKFDLHFLLNEHLKLADPRFIIHCTQAIGRVEYNDYMSYSLDSLGMEKLGKKKIDAVKEYCDKNGLFEMILKPGKKKKERKRFFNRVPLEIMVPYAEMDARITYDLGYSQIESILTQDFDIRCMGAKMSPRAIMDQERHLTKVLFEMERTGIKINRQYTLNACADSTMRYKVAESEFFQLTGMPFNDGPKTLTAAFEKLSLPYPKTEKGNPSFADEVLHQLPGKLGKVIQDYRGHYKKAHTYYANYLSLSDNFDQRIHANIRQGGTAFGRMSYSDPNLQNCNKVEKGDPEYEEEFLVRRCFIPDPGGVLVCLDYHQMEYRLMLDYSGEMEVIAQVLDGTDIHQATANLMGVPRSQAKTINFMLLYGGGTAKLAMALFDVTVTEEILKKIQKKMWANCSTSRIATILKLEVDVVDHNILQLTNSQNLKDLYFSKLRNVEKFIDGVVGVAKNRGYILNWMGRKSVFKDQSFCYKAPNALIQGGCADIVKKAMVEIHTLLAPYQSKMLIQVHDELVFWIKDDERHLVPDIKKIMETAYQPRFLPLTVGVDWSDKSWQDKKEWVA